MSSILASIKDVFASVFELIFSVIGTAFDVVKSAFSGIIGFIGQFLHLFVDLFKGLLEAAGGVGKFVVGNIFVLGVIAIGFFAFLQYQKKQGRPVKVGDKKLN